MNILVCFGTRPEAIKMAPVCHALAARKIKFKICVTAQHREMLDQVLEFFELVPDYDLDLMQPGQTLNSLSSLILKEIDGVLSDQNFTIVLVQGDTTTAAFVALAAFHKNIAVGHVEAGLRTYNKNAPFPEEVNRQIISRIANYHFVPTARAKSNLLKEGIAENSIYFTGNTVVDAVKWAEEKLNPDFLNEEIRDINLKLKKLKKIILVTGHRRESFGPGLIEICEALLELSKMENFQLIFPVHLNPKVSATVMRILGKQEDVHLIPPVSYPTMIWLMEKCDIIISDSGGIQEEAPTFGKKVLVTRETTERTEGLDSGFAVLVGTDKKIIISEAVKFLNGSTNSVNFENPYGDGKAAKRIGDILKTI